MVLFPKRGHGSFWMNQEPLVDLHETLDLLRYESETYEPNYLSHNVKLGVWEIVAPWYSHGDSGGDQSGYLYYQVDTKLAEQLTRDALVSGRRIEYHGGSYVNEEELVPTTAGHRRADTYWQESKTRALSLLQPGIHTDLTGEPHGRGWGREHRTYGRAYFDFEAPLGKFRIFPETNEIKELVA